jgi:hypothetical protein
MEKEIRRELEGGYSSCAKEGVWRECWRRGGFLEEVDLLFVCSFFCVGLGAGFDAYLIFSR